MRRNEVPWPFSTCARCGSQSHEQVTALAGDLQTHLYPGADGTDRETAVLDQYHGTLMTKRCCRVRDAQAERVALLSLDHRNHQEQEH